MAKKKWDGAFGCMPNGLTYQADENDEPSLQTTATTKRHDDAVHCNKEEASKPGSDNNQHTKKNPQWAHSFNLQDTHIQHISMHRLAKSIRFFRLCSLRRKQWRRSDRPWRSNADESCQGFELQRVGQTAVMTPPSRLVVPQALTNRCTGATVVMTRPSRLATSIGNCQWNPHRIPIPKWRKHPPRPAHCSPPTTDP